MSETTLAQQEETKTLVRYEVRDRIAVMTLEDPPANTYTHRMMRQLDEAILRARFDPEVDVIVITGAGEKFFCAGANINMLAESDPTWKYYFCLHANETLLRLEHTPKLVIAALNGHTVGGGLEIALAADLRIGRAGAGKVGLPEVSLGVLPGTGGTQRLTRLLGTSKAIQLMTEGINFDFGDAEKFGLVNRVMEGETSEAFLEKVMEYARAFARPGKASLAVGNIKRACQSGGQLPLEQGLALERELQALLFNSEDAREGLNAYVEKRSAEFTGR
jgi:enoyl-CoA hydratase